MPQCPVCGQALPASSRFCTRCGTLIGVRPSEERTTDRHKEAMNLPVLYVMAAVLFVALVFPPWESPSSQSPEFLGFHFFLSAPETASGEDGIISRMLLTIELVTIAAGGFYFSWLFRKRSE